MKKFVVSVVIVLICCFVGCSFFNAPYKQRMIEYYSNETNYKTLLGIVIAKNDNTAVLEIDISMNDHTFPVNVNNYQYFRLYTNIDILKNIEEDDVITFVSAPSYFYDGHTLPIVSLKKGGCVYLTFEEGQKGYLNWIEVSFS